MLKFKNGRLRIGMHDKEVKRYFLFRDDDEYAFIHIYRGVVIAAGYEGNTSNHDYYVCKPNWDMVIEMLSVFYNQDYAQFQQIQKSINKKTKEWKFLKESAKKYISSKMKELDQKSEFYRNMYEALK